MHGARWQVFVTIYPQKIITLDEPLIALPDKILKDLSTDQAYGYRIVTTIRTGVLPENLINLEIDSVSHSRWLTTANRFCRIWISFHFLTEKNFKNLSLFIEFIAGVCYPCWFQIKVKHSWLDGPRHILFQLKQLKYQKEEAIAIVNKTVRDLRGFHLVNALFRLFCVFTMKKNKN